MATSDEILEAANDAAEAGISSVSHNGKSTSLLDPLRQLEFADRLAARNAATEGDANRNSVGRILGRRARPSPQGAGGE